MKLFNFITFIVSSLFIVSCTPQSQSSQTRNVSDPALLIVKKFTPAQYKEAFGQSCASVDLKTLAEKTRVIGNGCELVAKALNYFHVDIKPTTAECKDVKGGDFYTESSSIKATLDKRCSYVAILKIGYKPTSGTAIAFMQAEKRISAQELASAPAGRLTAQLQLEVTQQGGAYGFGR